MTSTTTDLEMATATASTGTNVITKEILDQIEEFKQTFRSAHIFQAPEFTDPRNILLLGDIYRINPKGLNGRAANPVNTAWYPVLIRLASFEDLNILEKAFSPLTPSDRLISAYGYFFFHQLFEEAWNADKHGANVSRAIPLWLRERHYSVPTGWRCERDAEVIVTERAAKEKHLDTLKSQHFQNQARIRAIQAEMKKLEAEAVHLTNTNVELVKEHTRLAKSFDPATFLAKY